MSDVFEFDFWSDEHNCMLRPTPCLKFIVGYVPAPELGANICKGARILHQQFTNLNDGSRIWLPVEVDPVVGGSAA